MESGIHSFILSITPVTVHLLVNVSTPSTVWCSAMEKDSRLNELAVMNQRQGQYISGSIDGSYWDIDSSHLSILKLKPNTHYDIKCFAFRSAQPDVINIAKPIHVVTGDGLYWNLWLLIALFEIRSIKRGRRSITYHLHSNLDALYVCYLMNRKRIHLSVVLMESGCHCYSWSRLFWTSDSSF